MDRFKALLPALGVSLVALPAFASEGGEPGGVFAGDVGNVLWTLVIFGLVVFVLGKFAWKPILSGLHQREQFIRTSLEQAKRDRDEAEARLREYTEKLTAARAEATAIVEEARRDADVVRRRIEQDANDEASKIVERARREIDIARQTAVRDLFAEASRLTTEVAAKILEREIRPEDHERLLRDSIARLDAGEEN